MKVSKQNPLSHYKWGDNCDGWNLVAEAQAAIKQEQMPAGTAEKLHYHTFATQFFYVLKGSAEFLTDDTVIVVNQQEGLKIEAGKRHKIMNKTTECLEFLLFSYPSAQNDRTDCE